MKSVLRVLGLVTGIGPLMMALRTSWDSFDAYGSVSKGESRTVALPAGPISIAFETASTAFESAGTQSSGTPEDIPTITTTGGSEVPVEFMGQLQGPRLSRSGENDLERVRKRFATVEVPADGEYVVTAGACTVLLGTAGFSRKPRPAPAGISGASTG